MTSQTERTAKIRTLNDTFRTSCRLPQTGSGRVMITSGVNALGTDAVFAILGKVATFDDFCVHNDPYREHDFGSFEHAGETIFWKLDYYAHDLLHGSEDPANPDITTRVLTVMLSAEY